MTRKHMLILIGVLGGLLIILGLALHRSPQAESRKPAKKSAAAPTREEQVKIVTPEVVPAKLDFKPADPKVLGRALDDASIQSLIDNLRVSAEQDNEAITTSLIDSLRRRGSGARALIQREMARLEPDSKSYFAMAEVIR